MGVQQATTLRQGGGERLRISIVRSISHQYAGPPHSLRLLLRPRRERPRSHAAEQRDELAAFQIIELHSIPASQDRVAGYRIDGDQSVGVAGLA
jgi:hypothetical protein